MSILKKGLITLILICSTFSLFAGDKDVNITLIQLPSGDFYPRGAYLSVHSELSDTVESVVNKLNLEAIVDTEALSDSIYVDLIPEVFQAEGPIFVDAKYKDNTVNFIPIKIGDKEYVKARYEITLQVFSSEKKSDDEEGNVVLDEMIFSDIKDIERYVPVGKASIERPTEKSNTGGGLSFDMGSVEVEKGNSTGAAVQAAVVSYVRNRIQGMYGLNEYTASLTIFSPDGMFSSLSTENKSLSKDTAKLLQEALDSRWDGKKFMGTTPATEEMLEECSANYASLISQWIPGDKDAEVNDSVVWKFFNNKAICDALLFRGVEAQAAVDQAVQLGIAPPLEENEFRLGGNNLQDELKIHALRDFADRYIYSIGKVNPELARAFNNKELYAGQTEQAVEQISAIILNYNISEALELPYYFEYYPVNGFSTVPKQMTVSIIQNGTPLAEAQFKKKIWPSFLFSYTHTLKATNLASGISTKAYELRYGNPVYSSKSWGLPYRINLRKVKDEVSGLDNNFYTSTDLQWSLDSGLTVTHMSHRNSGFMKWVFRAIDSHISSELRKVTDGTENFYLDYIKSDTHYSRTSFDVKNGSFLAFTPVISMDANRYDIQITGSMDTNGTLDSSTSELKFDFNSTDESNSYQQIDTSSLSGSDPLAGEVSYTYDEMGNWTEAVVGPYTLTRTFIYE